MYLFIPRFFTLQSAAKLVRRCFRRLEAKRAAEKAERNRLEGPEVCARSLMCVLPSVVVKCCCNCSRPCCFLRFALCFVIVGSFDPVDFSDRSVLHSTQVLTVYHKGTVISGVPLMLSVLRCGNSYKFIGRDQEACWAHHGYCYEFEARFQAFIA